MFNEVILSTVTDGMVESIVRQIQCSITKIVALIPRDYNHLHVVHLDEEKFNLMMVSSHHLGQVYGTDYKF